MSSRILNLLLWWSFSALCGTGLLLALRLPPGWRGGRGWSALGLSRHEWGDVHTWMGSVFMLMIGLHLALHWRWLWQVAARKRPGGLWLGIGAGVALMLLLIFQPVKKGPVGRDHLSEVIRQGQTGEVNR